MEGHGGGEAPVRAAAAAAPSPAKGGKVEFGGVCLWDYWVGDWLCFVGTISWWGLCRAEHGLLKLNRPKIRIRFGL